MDHIKKNHPGLVQEVEQYRKSGQVTQRSKQKTLPEMVKKCTFEEVSFYFNKISLFGPFFFRIFIFRIFTFSFSQFKIACINLIAECNLSFHLIQSAGFRELIELVTDFEFEIPSTTAIMDTLSAQSKLIKLN